jgi:hypothetical protein
MLEFEYTTLLIGSEYKLFLNLSLCLTYTTTHCYIHLVGRVNFLLVFEEIILPRKRIFFTVLPLPSLEKVCGKLLIRSILVLLFSFEVPWEKIQQKKRNKKARRQHRRGFVCVFFCFVRWCFVITLVSRLVSLA